MGRAERRRAQKEEKKANTASYNYTQAQLDAAIEKRVGERLIEIRKNAKEDAINTALALTLTIPMKVLMEHYWQNTYMKHLPEFADHMLTVYEKWQDGEIDLREEQDKIWEFAGLKIVEDKE
jgi:hypothetical protein